MKKIKSLISIIVAVFLICNSSAGESTEEKELNKMISKLKPLHKKMGQIEPGDWLQTHKEPGQSLWQYLRIDPVVVTKRRKTIYIQPIGKFTVDEKRIVKQTARYLNAFYGLSVITKKDIPLSTIPAKARRVNFGVEQLLTTYILYDILKPKLPEDAILYLGMTSSDLWPGKGWNFVFGQASLRQRVGVWSINRNGLPSVNFKICLLRTLKTAVHEAGHMFSMRHCTAYECGMCGSNSRYESDRRPLAFCPECHAKVIFATKANPEKRLEKLIDFCKDNNLNREAEFYEKELKAIKAQ